MSSIKPSDFSGNPDAGRALVFEAYSKRKDELQKLVTEFIDNTKAFQRETGIFENGVNFDPGTCQYVPGRMEFYEARDWTGDQKMKATVGYVRKQEKFRLKLLAQELFPGNDRDSVKRQHDVFAFFESKIRANDPNSNMLVTSERITKLMNKILEKKGPDGKPMKMLSPQEKKEKGEILNSPQHKIAELLKRREPLVAQFKKLPHGSDGEVIVNEKELQELLAAIDGVRGTSKNVINIKTKLKNLAKKIADKPQEKNPLTDPKNGLEKFSLNNFPQVEEGSILHRFIMNMENIPLNRREYDRKCDDLVIAIARIDAQILKLDPKKVPESVVRPKPTKKLPPPLQPSRFQKVCNSVYNFFYSILAYVFKWKPKH